MVAVKAAQATAFTTEPPANLRLFLLYGTDQGAVSERAATLVSILSARDPQGATVLRIGSDELSGNPGRIADEAHADMLFGGAPLIRLKILDGRHNVVPSLRPLVEDPPEAAIIVVEADELRAGAPLRRLFEDSPNAAAIPFYESSVGDIADLARSLLREAGVTIEPDALDYLIVHLGTDRGVARREIEKLILYAGDGAEVTLREVTTVVGESTELRNDRLIDRTLTGDIQEVAADLSRLEAEGASPSALLAQMLNHLLMLAGLQAEVRKSGLAAAVDRARPPLHFRRKDSVKRALQIWSPEALRRARASIDEAILETRKLPALDYAITSLALMRLAQVARRVGRR
ncbi:DNA polymerase III subunit delta [Afifella sp. YEN Y35]|uniref:DNA polymerase III subunit delta n=1 Tax=Afifella sp. YEN Y35 TaxID=3388337 RepID=UPI0039E05AA1